MCEDEEPIWDPVCDPYHYDCGEDDCFESTGGGAEPASMEGCPAPGPGGDPGDGGDGDMGGAGGPGDESDEKPCDPATDPECEKPLTGADSASIAIALRDFLQPATAIADTAARRRCAEMLQWFQNTYAAGNVYRGGSNTTGQDAHYGYAYQGKLHMDPWLLNAANSGNRDAQREVANTALHEAAHVFGKEHPGGVTMDATGYGVYTDPYFDLLSPGPNSCITY